MVTKILEGFGPVGADGKKELKLRDAKKGCTLRHLLTHTAGLSYPWNEPSNSELFKPTEGEPHFPNLHLIETRDFNYPLLWEAGEKYIYGASCEWVGQFAVRTTGTNLRRLCKDLVFKPLGLINEDEIDLIPVKKNAGVNIRTGEKHSFMEIPFELYQPPDGWNPEEGKFWLGSGPVRSSLQSYRWENSSSTSLETYSSILILRFFFFYSNEQQNSTGHSQSRLKVIEWRDLANGCFGSNHFDGSQDGDSDLEILGTRFHLRVSERKRQVFCSESSKKDFSCDNDWRLLFSHLLSLLKLKSIDEFSAQVKPGDFGINLLQAQVFKSPTVTGKPGGSHAWAGESPKTRMQTLEGQDLVSKSKSSRLTCYLLSFSLLLIAKGLANVFWFLDPDNEIGSIIGAQLLVSRCRRKDCHFLKDDYAKLSLRSWLCKHASLPCSLTSDSAILRSTNGQTSRWMGKAHLFPAQSQDRLFRLWNESLITSLRSR